MVNQFAGQRDTLFLAGKTILEYYSLDGASKWAYLAYLAAFLATFTMGAWAGLAFRKYGVR